MRKVLLCTAAFLLMSVPSWATDNTVIVTPGSGVVMRSVDTTPGTTHIQSMMQILGDTSGVALATAPGTGNTVFALPIQGVSGGIAIPASQSGTWNVGTVTAVTAITNALPAGTNLLGHVIADTGSTTAVTQATAANLNATVVGTGTFVVQAAQSGTWNVGTVTAVTAITNALPAGTNVIGHIICDSGCSGSGGTSSNFTATFPSAGTAIGVKNGTNMVNLTADGSGNLNVNIASGGGSGGTAVADNTTSNFTLGTTLETPIGCYAGTPSATANRSTIVACTTAGSVHTTVDNTNTNIGNNVDGVTVTATPFTACCSPVNSYLYGFNTTSWDRLQVDGSKNLKVAIVANSAINLAQVGGASVGLGATTSSASIPVVIASDQTAVAVKAASAAFASGSLASGAVVDITNMSVATGAAPPTKAIYLGANSAGATGGQVAGLITCNSHAFQHITSATDTNIVAGVASQTVYICGWRSRAAGVATWYLENNSTTGSGCGATLTQITGVATEAANTGEVMQQSFWNGLKNTSGNGVCIKSTGTGGVDIDIWYAQF